MSSQFLVPPWFRAPLGSMQWCTAFRSPSISGVTSVELWFTHDRQLLVPRGWYAVVVAAWIAGSILVGAPAVGMPLLWRLRSKGELVLNDMPAAWEATVTGVFPQLGNNQRVEPPPILAPVVIDEEKGATLEVYDDSSSGDPYERCGWVCGWLCPKVNDRPGAEQFHTTSVGG